MAEEAKYMIRGENGMVDPGVIRKAVIDAYGSVQAQSNRGVEITSPGESVANYMATDLHSQGMPTEVLLHELADGSTNWAVGVDGIYVDPSFLGVLSLELWKDVPGGILVIDPEGTVSDVDGRFIPQGAVDYYLSQLMVSSGVELCPNKS